MRLYLAPMEGLVDPPLRRILTAIGGVDACVTEFIRVTNSLLPPKVFYRYAPELLQDAKTRAGTPVAIQLLGSDPACLAENAARAVELGAPEIDLNFGCPAKTVNRHRGGSVLLEEPELLFRILSAVRKAVPDAIPVTAKMRLGYADKTPALVCAQALEAGGAARIAVHARTKAEGYRPPSHWEWLALIREQSRVPVIANGDIWSTDDWLQCKNISGCEDFMLGRGLITRPDLAMMIRCHHDQRPYAPMGWNTLLPLLNDFFQELNQRTPGVKATGRLKQWLVYLRQQYPEAAQLFQSLKRATQADQVHTWLSSPTIEQYPETMPSL